MSPTIKLTTALGGHKVGDTITVTPKVAQHLTDHGHVDTTHTDKPTKKTKNTRSKADTDETQGGGTPSDS